MESRSQRAKKIIETFFPKEDSLEVISEAVLFCHNLREVRIEAPQMLLETWKKIDGFLLRKDPPHFQGDEYHVHAPLSGGYEASWGVSGPRRHPSKFPADVPSGLRKAAAKFLKISPDLLEAWWIGHPGEKVLLLEVTKWKSQ